jgi:hypothetical protein
MIKRARGPRLAFLGLLGSACLAGTIGAGFGDAAAHHYRLRRGDYVEVPALRWTCLMSSVQSRPIFTCTTDNKRVRSVTLGLHDIWVGVTHQPAAVHGGYRFSY